LIIRQSWNPVSMIWISSHSRHHHLIISDNTMWKRLQNVYSLANQRNQTQTTVGWACVRPYDNHLLSTLSPTNLLPTVGYLCFLYVPSSSVKTPSSSRFASEVKTHSIPFPDPGQPWNCTVHDTYRMLITQTCLSRFIFPLSQLKVGSFCFSVPVRREHWVWRSSF
jgi:hypothetical protein